MTVLAWNSADATAVVDNDIGDVLDLSSATTYGSATATSFGLNTGGEAIIFTGTGLGGWDVHGYPTTGTVTGYHVVDLTSGAITEFSVSGFSLAASALTGFFNTSDGVGLRNAVFGGGDSLTGGPNSDYLEGYGGVDTIHAGGGDDFILAAGGLAGETYDGGSGTDTLVVEVGSASGQFYGVAADFTAATLVSLEAVQFDPNNSGFTAAVFSSTQLGAGLASNLQVVGNAQNNDLVFKMPSAGALDLSQLTFSNWTSAFGADLVTAIGSSGADTIIGSSQNDLILGGAGNDTLLGGAGNDVLSGGSGSNLIDGGTGYDSLLMTDLRANYSIRSFYSGGHLYTQVNDQIGTDGSTLLVNVEQLVVFDGGASVTGVIGLYGIQQNHEANLAGGRFDDVLFQNAVTHQIAYVDMTGSATTNGGFKAVIGSLPAGWDAVGTGDFTGTGVAAVLIQNTNNGSIYRYSGGAWSQVGPSLSSDWHVKAVGDFTGDGVLDVVIHNNVTGVNYLENITAGGAFGGFTAFPNVGAGWNVIGAGDMDSDGYSDLIIQNASNGVTYYANMDAGAFSGWGVISGALPAAWQAKAVGDINGDGYADVVFQNSTTGDIWFANMAGGHNSGWGVVGHLPGWNVTGMADVNNDGYADVIVQNAANGTTYYADMHGGVFSGWGVVSGAIGTGWHAL